jgi:hypothetical protein
MKILSFYDQTREMQVERAPQRHSTEIEYPLF